MINIRPYRDSDAISVGALIADTYAEYNLGFAAPGEMDKLLGPFRHARSSEQAHQQAIAATIKAQIVLVAEDGEELVGVLRGKLDQLQSLFVSGKYHRQGVGRSLVERFEHECVRQGAKTIRVASTLYAVPFYQTMGYKKTTGVRPGRSFEGSGLVYQPMKKVLAE